MGNVIKVGVIIADEQEYKPVRDMAKPFSATVQTFYGDELTVISLHKNDQTIEINFVLCGIGKVNAAAATAFLITQGVSYIINSGLSGGISGVLSGEIVIGKRFIEHDFDLTPLGFKPAEKPQETYFYSSDERLNKILQTVCPQAKTGVMVCGDRFVSNAEEKDWLTNTFSAFSCDMESAAVASVCHKAGIPFGALRRISDDAGEGAPESYREMNDKAETVLVELLMKSFEQMFGKDTFFSNNTGI